jgi:hypothetical protein
MGIVRINQLPSGSSVTDDDLLLILDDPNGNAITKRISASLLRNSLLSQPAALQLRQGLESELLSVIPSLGEPVFSTNKSNLYIGDGYTQGGYPVYTGPIYPSPLCIPSGMMRIKSNSSSSSHSATFNTSTGYLAVQTPSGDVRVFGNGNPNSSITASITLNASNTGIYAKNSIKELYYWSCSSGNAAQSGNIINFSSSASSKNFEINFEEMTSLTGVSINSDDTLKYIHLKNNVSGVDITANLLPNLEWIKSPTAKYCNVNANSNLQWADFSNASGLTTAYLSSNSSLSKLNLKNCINLSSLFIGDSNLSSIDLSSNINLAWLVFTNAKTTSLNFSNNKINNLDLTNSTSLQSITFSPSIISSNTFVLDGCTNLSQINFNNSYGNFSFKNCQFSAAQLNNIYNLLPTAATSKTIYVYGNPGISTHNTSIATAKNYIVDTTTT